MIIIINMINANITIITEMLGLDTRAYSYRRVPYCRAESHKENQPDVQGVKNESEKQPSLQHGRRTPSSPVSQSNGDKDHEAAAAPVKRPSIFGSVALLAESSSSSTPSRSVHHRLATSASPFAVATNVDAPPFVTPPYTPRSRCQPGRAAAATPLAVPPTLQQQQQPMTSRTDDLSASLMTSPSVMTPDNHHQRQHALQMTYTPPFTPIRPATTTPIGRPRSRLSLNCPSPMQDLTRPSLALVSRINCSSLLCMAYVYTLTHIVRKLQYVTKCLLHTAK